MQHMAQIVVEPAAGQGRRVSRRLVDFAASVRESGAKLSAASITDLSVEGCRIRSDHALEVDHVIWLKISGLSARRSRIVWVKGNEAGCEFFIPLQPGTLEQLTQGARKPLRQLFGAGR